MSRPRRQPNIILITPDQFHARALGVAGNEVVQTPHLDALANDGLRFTNCHVHNWVCTPSRATLVTGAHPSVHGVVFNDMDLDVRLETVAGRLGTAGYRTGHVGKWHVRPRGHDFGFQERIGHAGYQSYLEAQGIKPESASEHGEDWTKNNATWISPIPEEHYITTWETDRALEFVEGSAGRPFFLWLSPEKPHLPYNPPAEWAHMYDPTRIPLPDTWNGDVSTDVEAKTADSIEHWRTGMAPAEMSEDDIRQTIAFYYASISLVDHNIGRLRARLGELGLADDTVIVFTSDHGEMLGEHRLLNKGPYPFDALTRVPAIIHDPRLDEARTIEEVVGQESLLTTILAAAGIEPARTMRGVDLRGLVPDSGAVSGFHFGPHYDTVVRTVRTDTFRYTVYGNADGSIVEELFDVEADPYETVNLASRIDSEPKLHALRAELLFDIVRRDHDRPEVLEISDRFSAQNRTKGVI